MTRKSGQPSSPRSTTASAFASPVTYADARWEGTPLRHALAVRCGLTTFVLLANTSPVPVSGRLALPSLATAHLMARLHDPEADKSHDLPAPVAGVIESLTVPAHGTLILIVTES